MLNGDGIVCNNSTDYILGFYLFLAGCCLVAVSVIAFTVDIIIGACKGLRKNWMN